MSDVARLPLRARVQAKKRTVVRITNGARSSKFRTAPSGVFGPVISR